MLSHYHPPTVVCTCLLVRKCPQGLNIFSWDAVGADSVSFALVAKGWLPDAMKVHTDGLGNPRPCHVLELAKF